MHVHDISISYRFYVLFSAGYTNSCGNFATGKYKWWEIVPSFHHGPHNLKSSIHSLKWPNLVLKNSIEKFLSFWKLSGQFEIGLLIYKKVGCRLWPECDFSCYCKHSKKNCLWPSKPLQCSIDSTTIQIQGFIHLWEVWTCLGSHFGIGPVRATTLGWYMMSVMWSYLCNT